nr:pentatricopeptide repeat-containing protein, chloroplastic [Quercus suber]
MGDLRDLVSWTAMVYCFANNDMGIEAIVTLLQMLENGLCPNEYCFSTMIQACSNVENVTTGKMIFGFVIKTGYFESDVCVGCALIDMFMKGGCDVDLAYKVFEKMPKKNSQKAPTFFSLFITFKFQCFEVHQIQSLLTTLSKLKYLEPFLTNVLCPLCVNAKLQYKQKGQSCLSLSDSLTLVTSHNQIGMSTVLC